MGPFACAGSARSSSHDVRSSYHGWCLWDWSKDWPWAPFSRLRGRQTQLGGPQTFPKADAFKDHESVMQEDHLYVSKVSTKHRASLRGSK